MLVDRHLLHARIPPLSRKISNFPGHVGHPGRGLMWQRIRPSKVDHQVGHDPSCWKQGDPVQGPESPELCFGRHHVLRRNQLGRRMATADTQIFTEGSMSSIRCGHHLARSIALDSPRRVAGRTRHAVAFMCNVLSVQLNRGRGGLHGSVSSRLVAV